MGEFPADMINATSDMLKSIIDQLTAENADLCAKLEKDEAKCAEMRELLGVILEVADLLDYDDTNYWTNRITKTLTETEAK